MIDQIIREHSPGVARFIASHLSTPDRVEDAQDCCSRAAHITCEKYFMGLITPSDDAKTLVGYFYNCAKNVAREENARYFRRQRLLDENLSLIRDNLFHDDKYMREVIDAIETIFDFIKNHLSEREVRILELHYREGLSLEDIAVRMDLMPANVRKIRERAIKKIRDLISRFRGPDGPGSGRIALERHKSKCNRAVTETGTRQIQDNIKLFRQIGPDYQADIIIQLMNKYGSICMELNIRMFQTGALSNQIELLNEYSDNLINNIRLTALILSKFK